MFVGRDNRPDTLKKEYKNSGIHMSIYLKAKKLIAVLCIM